MCPLVQLWPAYDEGNFLVESEFPFIGKKPMSGVNLTQI